MGSFLTNMSLARGYLKENIFIVNSINQYIPLYHLTLVGLVLIPIIIRPANWKDTQVLVVRKQLTKFTASRLALLTWKMKCFIYNIVIQKSCESINLFQVWLLYNHPDTNKLPTLLSRNKGISFSNSFVLQASKT